ncbi:MAG: Mut7-C RNAse domain-containing protein [Verrucomicrobia bacterium]|nr:Mut7-C RNAse domain-containing protein [Verrucomicrobiota bacterium]
MVVKTGKYLRILGYNAVWQASLRTHELIASANRDGRIFLTRNAHIPYSYPPPARWLRLISPAPTEQLAQITAEYGLDPEKWLFSRCIKCNVLLERIDDKEYVRDKVHPNVFARHEQFYRCPSCGTVFWHGSHVVNTRGKLGIG